MSIVANELTEHLTENLTEQEALLERVRIEAQLHDYWHDVDRHWGRNAAIYYTEDAVFGGELANYTGRQEIQAFYQFRIDRGIARVAVHSVTNFRVAFEGHNRAQSTWYLLAYAADGAPVLPTHPPINITLVSDTYERQSDGRWLCAHRHFEVLFAGGTKPTNQKVDQQ
jgi:ketosteroid isomerase-like protein